MHLYLLCGLGADERLFRYLNFSPLTATPVKWIKPEPDDTMEEYAIKLLPQITEVDPVLIGVSFGGMMAIEIGKLIPTQKIILISSSANESEIPKLFRLAGRLKINRLIPGFVLKRSHMVLNWIMRAKDKVRRELLADMLRNTDERFLYWAIDKVVTWKNRDIPPNVVRIHGTADKVLPITKSDFTIEGGGHLIVANYADEVNSFLVKIFHDLTKENIERQIVAK